MNRVSFHRRRAKRIQARVKLSFSLFESSNLFDFLADLSDDSVLMKELENLRHIKSNRMNNQPLSNSTLLDSLNDNKTIFSVLLHCSRHFAQGLLRVLR